MYLFCRLFSDWANCMVRPVLDTCNSAAMTYMKTLLNKTLYPQWHKNWVPCTIGMLICQCSITFEISSLVLTVWYFLFSFYSYKV